MKKNLFLNCCLLLFVTTPLFSQSTTKINLHKLVSDKGLTVVNRELSLINEGSYSGIRLSKEEGEGIAWIKDVDFSNGIIEFDVRGEDIKQHSFVGFAFHGADNKTFDAIYFRPFQFREEDAVLKNRRIQYISLPDFTWQVLRAKFPSIYENNVEPAPDPNNWFKVRIVIKDTTISTYINGAKEPSLVVNKVTARKTGAIGFYVADTSGGDFANLSITKTQ